MSNSNLQFAIDDQADTLQICRDCGGRAYVIPIGRHSKRTRKLPFSLSELSEGEGAGG